MRTLDVVTLDDETEELFLDHVNQDPLEHYFFILDWRFNRDESRILLALEDDAIEGLLLIYKDLIAQVRGSREAIGKLIGHLDLQRAEIVAPREHGDLVLESYGASKRYELLLMHLGKGEERALKTHEPVRPSPGDAEGIARLMRETCPDFWGEQTAEKVEESMKRNFWLAIKDNEKVISVGNTFFADFGSNIGVVATHEGYRNQGCATSIVSSLVGEIFRRCDRALIHVIADNNPAVHTYRKVGFRPYRSYLLVKGERT
ncbi:MAG: GNAT family N-acetyltransferase [Thermoplasmata archaeon]